jgi:hypothetical protein
VNIKALCSNNYKSVFVELIKERHKLENGSLFKSWPLGPAEVHAMAAYKNVLATGELKKESNNNYYNINNRSHSRGDLLDARFRNIYIHQHTNLNNQILY